MVGSLGVSTFWDQGFLVVGDPLLTPGEVSEVRRLLDPLFQRFDSIPNGWARDLGEVGFHDGPQQVPEIAFALRLEPALAATAAYSRCRELAAVLLGARASCYFDHAVYKPAHNGTTTAWHQDAAADPHGLGNRAIHVWLALDDVSAEMGCMEFIPGSHRHGIVSHRPRTPAAHALVAEAFSPDGAQACPIPAGAMTVHGPRTLHCTGPNRTDRPRRSWTLQFAPTRQVLIETVKARLPWSRHS
jgi:ectoine hydroxylase-related dioxygenase (phytanoyl-CoA dioxygenase family)